MTRHFCRASAAVVVLLAAGCGGSSTSPSQSTTSAASPEPDATVAPEPERLTEQEYRSALRAAQRRAGRAFASVRDANTHKRLLARLDTAADDLEVASEEFAGLPPADVPSVEHDEVRTGLQALAERVRTLRTKVEEGGTCTGPDVLAELSRSGAASDVRSAAAALGADRLAPRKAKRPNVKLQSGVLFRRGDGGPGELEITNRNTRDRVVKIRAGGNRMSIYVRARGATTVTGIADGRYTVYVAGGTSWDGRRNTFSRSCEFSRMQERMRFTSGGGQYVRFTLTLNPASGGNAPSDPIDPDGFPRD